MTKPMFIEGKGGEVLHAASGEIIATVCVEAMTTAEAAQAMQAVLSALNAEFGDDARPNAAAGFLGAAHVVNVPLDDI